MSPEDYKKLGKNLPKEMFSMPVLDMVSAARWLYDLVEGHLSGVGKYDRTPGDNPYWNPLVKSALEAGWELLGSGHFSAVFTHAQHSDLAFKVGFKKEDAGAQYAAWCRANAGKGLRIPEILMMGRFKEAYVVVMPKYTPMRSPHKYSDEFGQAAAILNYGSGHGVGELQDTARAIREFFNGMAAFDLHAANAMVDAEGHIIITDPVSETRQGSDDPEVWVAERMRSLSQPALTPKAGERMVHLDLDRAMMNFNRAHWLPAAWTRALQGVHDEFRAAQAIKPKLDAEFKMGKLDRLAANFGAGRQAPVVPGWLGEFVAKAAA